MMFPNLPAMWLELPVKFIRKCKKCGDYTDMKFLVDGVCGPCRIEAVRCPPGMSQIWPPTSVTGGDYYYGTSTATITTSAANHTSVWKA